LTVADELTPITFGGSIRFDRAAFEKDFGPVSDGATYALRVTDGKGVVYEFTGIPAKADEYAVELDTYCAKASRRTVAGQVEGG
jgi:hypothetical protein